MGLDIMARNKITKAQNGEAFDESGELKWQDGWFHIYIPEDLPNRAPELQNNCAYKSENEFSFQAGSYGGYNQWRNELAILAGYQSAEYVWGNIEGGPFIELINFSDCEGTIGAIISAKLARDFVDFEGVANQHEDEWFRIKYHKWKKAFEFASENGCVIFQ